MLAIMSYIFVILFRLKIVLIAFHFRIPDHYRFKWLDLQMSLEVHDPISEFVP